MTPREFLLEFLKFHYKRNPFRKQETNEKDVEDFMAELPADIEVKKFHKPLVSGSVSFADALAFAEYFRNQFDYYDCNAKGRVYKYIDLRKRGQTAMTMEQIFVEWKAKETDR